MSYTTARSGFTAPQGKGGKGTPYHQDLKLLSSLPIGEKVKMIDAVARQNQSIGREIEFSNPAVSGRRWNPGAELAEKVDLLEKAAGAHSHSQHSGWQSFDYYTPFKGKSRFDKGAVEDASIYLPVVPGGTVKRGSGGGYGYYSEALDPSGKVIARVGHGNIDRPEAETTLNLPTTGVLSQTPQVETTDATTRTEDILKAFLYGASTKKPEKTFEEQLKDQIVGGIISQALTPSSSFLSGYNQTDPYMSGFNTGSKDFFGGIFG
jgi:hypothetical protein